MKGFRGYEPPFDRFVATSPVCTDATFLYALTSWTVYTEATHPIQGTTMSHPLDEGDSQKEKLAANLLNGYRHMASSRTGEHAAGHHPTRHTPEALATVLLRARSPGF
jgi:hypothetical protein